MAKDKKRMLMVRAKKIARDKQRAVLRRKAADAASGAGGFEMRYGCLRSEIRNAPVHRVLVSRSIDVDGIGDGIDPAECKVEFTYGQDGKPHYVSGPNHTPSQSRQIIAQLHRQLGPDGFNFTVGIGNFLEDE